MSKINIGIVGLPNAGKSTLFNALLKKQMALAANYPFATIEPNVGIVPVPDPRLEKLAEITMAEEGMDKLPPIIPGTIEFVDIAGLVAGAHKGEGLGNKFLSHIREVHVIVNVLRFFEDPDIVHTEGSVDPIRDKQVIETELILADLQTLEKQKEPKGKVEKEEKRKWELTQILKAHLEKDKPARTLSFKPEDSPLVDELHLLTMKPVLYVCNVSEETATMNEPPHQTKDLDPHLLVSAQIEQEVSGLPESEQQEYLVSLGFESSGLDRIIQKTYDMLGLMSFLTAGEKEVRAWTIQKGTSAPKAAAVIHTDFEKKFIKAEVVSFAALEKAGTRKIVKESGKLQLEGKEYVLQDGDVVEFKIGA